MKILVTGADGFVGHYLTRRLVEDGHHVIGGCRPGIEPHAAARLPSRIAVVPFELSDSTSVAHAVEPGYDAIVHLAAIASVREAQADPARAWIVNAAGTARLLSSVEATRARNGFNPLVLLVSTAEVYGCGPQRPRVESDLPRPQSQYAASKLGAEIAALEAARRAGVQVIIARPFTHTGPGQGLPYVIPSFITRLQAVTAGESGQVPTGNLNPIRDFLDVRDVVDAYRRLLETGVPGEIYNISRGEGISLLQLFRMLARIMGVEAEPVSDPALQRVGDIPYLVGDSSKLRQATRWSPVIPLEQTLRDMVNAQAH